MRNKKLLSTMLATALVATSMTMPVMAADGGEVDVTVTTKNAVIRVEVPTTLSVAVNQFEKGDTGSQIYSAAFDITNKSEIPVKMKVTSKATLASTGTIDLVSSKDAVSESTSTNGAAWLAVAAKTSAGKYTEESGKDIKDLTEASKNVATFVQGTDAAKSTATAEQTFYLNANATPTVTYTKVAPTDAAELKEAQEISYAQFYEVTAMGTQPADEDALQTAVDASDVCAIDGSDAVTFLEKGTVIEDAPASGSTYYTVASTPTDVKSLAASKIYIYGEAAAATTGGAAGFRYIGKLSEKDNWSATDISNINIKYEIAGVQTTKYDEVETSCVYGLYDDGPQMTVSASGLITITGLTADANFSALRIKNDAGTFNVNDAAVDWNLDNYSETNGGSCTCQLGDGWVSSLAGKTGCEVYLDLTNDTTITVAISIPAPSAP